MQFLVLLDKSVVSNTTRNLILANNLLPVRKILKWLCKTSLLNIFWTCLSHLVTQKVRLKKNNTLHKKIYHTRGTKNISHSRHKKWITLETQKTSHSRHKKCITLEAQKIYQRKKGITFLTQKSTTSRYCV